MKKTILKISVFITISLCAGFAGAFSFYLIAKRNYSDASFAKMADNQPSWRNVNFTGTTAGINADFVKASQQSRNCVVYIKVQSAAKQQQGGFGWDFWDFFGNVGPSSSSGSGVIISNDGYIVTNNHVVEGGDKIEVILNNNKKSFKATIIGTDPSTDLALIKIDGNNLPAITFANSEVLQIGEWVLAVGNPFNLTSSVTAGIVSAKGRNININHGQFPIESFIQTDAAINPGNSGGALVNTDGQLVGVNAAILSKTGSYSGYGFAIPSNIVKKIVTDLKDFGYVQRAFVEASIVDISESVAAGLSDDNMSGAYVESVPADGNAAKGGLMKGDVITKVGNSKIENHAEFDEQLALHRPGDNITLEVRRGNVVRAIPITLSNQWGTTTNEKAKSYKSARLGAEFEEISKMEKEKYKITSGIRIFNITGGNIGQMGLQEGFIITSFNGKIYADPNELISAMEAASGRIVIEGINSNGSRGTYSFYRY